MVLKNFFKSLLSIIEQHQFFTIGDFSIMRKGRLKDRRQKAYQAPNSLFEHSKGQSKEFVPITESPYTSNPDIPKLLAYYLPQFHSIPLNDKNFGKGFTEWTNVTRSVPLFDGHHQPQIPYDVGFYDLSHVDVMYRQVELAKLYGISGFCFYYYWFSGQPILETPLKNWLEHKDLDLEYCFFWANASWTNTWWGGQNEMIIKQKYLPGDEIRFLRDILPYFKDDRYIKINNCPMLIVSRPGDMSLERFLTYFSYIRQGVQEAGFNDLYLVYVENFDNKVDAQQWGINGSVEFFPRGLDNKSRHRVEHNVPQGSNLDSFSLKPFLDKKEYLYESDHTVFKSLFATWDNSARVAFKHAIRYEDITPQDFTVWLHDIIRYTKQYNSPQEQYIFINAWNEWGEGAHLEPDIRYGYKWLQAVKDALESYSDDEP